jgi:hypothetical protein
MKHHASYLLFKANYAKMTDSERFFLFNRLIHVLSEARLESQLYRYDPRVAALEHHLRTPIQRIDQVWWMQLRGLTEAPLFSTVLRQL